jgi:hypothetical protein
MPAITPWQTICSNNKAGDDANRRPTRPLRDRKERTSLTSLSKRQPSRSKARSSSDRLKRQMRLLCNRQRQIGIFLVEPAASSCRSATVRRGHYNHLNVSSLHSGRLQERVHVHGLAAKRTILFTRKSCAVLNVDSSGTSTESALRLARPRTVFTRIPHSLAIGRCRPSLHRCPLRPSREVATY